MANSDFLTLKEVAQVLGVDTNAVNKLLESGKLQPVRHEGSFKFRRSDVDQLANPAPNIPSAPAAASSTQVTKYSLNDVLRELQIEEDQLQQLIADGEIQACLEQGAMKFDRNEIERYKNAKQVDVTIVVEKHGGSASKKSPSNELRNIEAPIPVPDLETPVNLPTPKPKIEANDFYSKSQVLDKLQIEESQLQTMLEDGELTACTVNGELCFKKTEIEDIRNERMVDATMVVEKANKPSSKEAEPIVMEEPIELLDDAAIMGLQEATQDTKPTHFPPQQSTPQRSLSSFPSKTGVSSPVSTTYPTTTEEYYTFDEALYELQISATELKNWVTQRQIPAITDPNGNFKFRKQDVEARRSKVEPTVILPDEPGTEDKDEKLDTQMLSDGFDLSLPQDAPLAEEEKDFYSIAEAAQLLEISTDSLKVLIARKNIQPYRLEGESKIKKNDFLILKELVTANKQSIPTAIASPPTPPQSEFCTMDEAIKILKIDQQTFRMMGSRGELRLAKQVGDVRYFYRNEILALAAKKDAAQPGSPGAMAAKPAVPAVVRPGVPGAMAAKPAVPAVVRPGVPGAMAAKPAVPAVVKPGVQIAAKPGFPMGAKPAALMGAKPAAPMGAKPAVPMGAKPAVPMGAKPAAPMGAKPATPMGAKPAVQTPAASLLDDEKCTIQEAMQILSLQKTDIERLANEKKLTLLPGNFIKKSELENLKHNRGVEITMMLPLDQKEEDEEAAVVAAKPSVLTQPSTLKPVVQSLGVAKAPAMSPAAKPPLGVAKAPAAKPSLGVAQATTAKPPLGVVQAHVATKLPGATPASRPGNPPAINWNDYCSQQQVLIALQIEQNELDDLVRSGQLKCLTMQGKQYYRKDEVELYKRSKMIEPTLMVDDNKELLADDGEDMFK